LRGFKSQLINYFTCREQNFHNKQHHQQQQEQTANMVRKSFRAISESLGWSKTDIQPLFALLCRPEQLQVFLKYHASKEATGNENRKYGPEKQTLVKFAMEALEEQDQK
jgi:hypothetical protein